MCCRQEQYLKAPDPALAAALGLCAADRNSDPALVPAPGVMCCRQEQYLKERAERDAARAARMAGGHLCWRSWAVGCWAVSAWAVLCCAGLGSCRRLTRRDLSHGSRVLPPGMGSLLIGWAC